MKASSVWAAMAACAIMLAWCHHAAGYDAETHGLITYQAYQESVLSQTGVSSTVSRLGLDRLDIPMPFHIYWDSAEPDEYYDAAFARQPNYYEQCQLQHLVDKKQILPSDPMVNIATGKVAFLPIQNWLLRGALREDDLTHLGYLIASEPPRESRRLGGLSHAAMASSAWFA